MNPRDWWQPYLQMPKEKFAKIYWLVVEERAAEIVSHAERLKNNNADITGAPRKHMTFTELEGWCMSMYDNPDMDYFTNEHLAGWLAHIIWTTNGPYRDFCPHGEWEGECPECFAVTKKKKRRKNKGK